MESRTSVVLGLTVACLSVFAFLFGHGLFPSVPGNLPGISP